MEKLEKFKTEGKVFDKKTLLNLYKLMKKGVLKRVDARIKEGKESVILSALADKEWVAVKIYRTLYCDFKRMWKFLASDPRFNKIGKRRRAVVMCWARREFKNLKIAYLAKVSCPKPIALWENVLVMSFVGKDGLPAPTLARAKGLNWRKIYAQVKREIEKLARAGLIHTDLSAYNILYLDRPYLIDFSQAITARHPLASELLERDVKNINDFFKRVGVETDDNLLERLKRRLDI